MKSLVHFVSEYVLLQKYIMWSLLLLFYRDSDRYVFAAFSSYMFKLELVMTSLGQFHSKYVLVQTHQTGDFCCFFLIGIILQYFYPVCLILHVVMEAIIVPFFLCLFVHSCLLIIAGICRNQAFPEIPRVSANAQAKSENINFIRCQICKKSTCLKDCTIISKKDREREKTV